MDQFTEQKDPEMDKYSEITDPVWSNLFANILDSSHVWFMKELFWICVWYFKCNKVQNYQIDFPALAVSFFYNYGFGYYY